MSLVDEVSGFTLAVLAVLLALLFSGGAVYFGWRYLQQPATNADIASAFREIEPYGPTAVASMQRALRAEVVITKLQLQQASQQAQAQADWQQEYAEKVAREDTEFVQRMLPGRSNGE